MLGLVAAVAAVQSLYPGEVFLEDRFSPAFPVVGYGVAAQDQIENFVGAGADLDPVIEEALPPPLFLKLCGRSYGFRFLFLFGNEEFVEERLQGLEPFLIPFLGGMHEIVEKRLVDFAVRF